MDPLTVATFSDVSGTVSVSCVRRIITNNPITVLVGPMGTVIFKLEGFGPGGFVYSFPVQPSVDAGGSLVDGNYTASDGQTPSVEFYRFFGDSNSDRKVDAATDQVAFNAAFNSQSGQPAYTTSFDWDNNGVINNADKLKFSKNLAIGTLPQ
jgi:hypothetical protein